ncbi:hypothetical protein ACLOJK_028771 [Asimina triloba]
MITWKEEERWRYGWEAERRALRSSVTTLTATFNGRGVSVSPSSSPHLVEEQRKRFWRRFFFGTRVRISGTGIALALLLAMPAQELHAAAHIRYFFVTFFRTDSEQMIIGTERRGHLMI